MAFAAAPVRRVLQKSTRSSASRSSAVRSRTSASAAAPGSGDPPATPCAWGGTEGGCAVCALFADDVPTARFRRDVYHYVASVQPGAVATYASVAAAVGRPRASRAVGSAMRRNTLNIVGVTPRVPCHRVVRSDGALAGFNGGGCTVKADMLRSEGVTCDSVRIPKDQLAQYIQN
jgi:methylated-DNA-[protein]-cysteine S-methyltransferase